MTSSLVGSEMCIRDRDLTGERYAAWLHEDSGNLVTPQLNVGTPDPSSVSYTHLTLPTICSV
eukprot:3173963-Prorocentrum_lima.AAC.1